MQTSCQNGDWCAFLPISTINEDSLIDFNVSASSDEYLDLMHTCMHVQVQITKPDGTNLNEGTVAGPNNYWFRSLFSQLDIYLNNKLVTDSSHTCAYKAFLETFINLPFDSKAIDSFLTGVL